MRRLDTVPPKHSGKRRLGLPVLQIAEPCGQDWEAMEGEERVKHCGECDQNVYNLTGMGFAEARELIDSHENNPLCVRFYQRPDGSIITRDCRQLLAPVRAQAAKHGWFWVGGGLVALLLISSVGLMTVRDGHGRVLARRIPVVKQLVNWLAPEPEMLMGAMVAPSPPPTPHTPSSP